MPERASNDFPSDQLLQRSHQLRIPLDYNLIRSLYFRQEGSLHDQLITAESVYRLCDPTRLKFSLRKFCDLFHSCFHPTAVPNSKEGLLLTYLNIHCIIHISIMSTHPSTKQLYQDLADAINKASIVMVCYAARVTCRNVCVAELPRFAA